MEQEYGLNWLREDEQNYSVYRINSKIVGIVDYQVFERDDEYHPTNEIFSYSNSVYIRVLFAESEEIMMEGDLSSLYKKRIVINVTILKKYLGKQW